MTPLIAIDDVSVAYSNKTILNDINIEVMAGEFVVVIGQTGCGKSTLLRLVLGQEQPSRGRILIEGCAHDHPDRHRGYVPQKYSLFPDKTVLENITFGPEVEEFAMFNRFTPRFRRSRREFQSRAFELLRHMGLSESDGAKYPDQLSGGMQQRVAIAQALIMQPKILLMDEAFSALDPGTRDEMQMLVRRLWRETGTTILFVTHNISEAVILGTRVIMLANPDGSGSKVVLDSEVYDGLLERIGGFWQPGRRATSPSLCVTAAP